MYLQHTVPLSIVSKRTIYLSTESFTMRDPGERGEVRKHLVRALEVPDSEKKNFHIRQALQSLEGD
jgi:hypothetical protein